jgi:Lrp/AsnC family leucine-responsive transcriptional regulator
MSAKLSRQDLAILRYLQEDGRISNRDLASKVALSPSPCWRRVRALESQLFILGYTALLDPQKLGLSILAFAHVSLVDHHPATVERFDQSISQAPEVLECFMTSGDHDYMLKVVTTDMASYQDFLSEKLLRLDCVRTVNTSFAMKQKKISTRLPLETAQA